MAKEKAKVKEKVKTPEEEFDEKVAELKKKSKEELLEIVQIQSFGYELRDFMAARKALDELKVEYPLTFKVKCEDREVVPKEIPIEEQDKSKPELKPGESVEAEIPKEEPKKKAKK